MSTISDDVPLLSIVVPTRNRGDCAISLARSLCASAARSFELILHDNSDDDSLGEAIADLADARIRYFHSPDRMNMHENFTRAIVHSRGIYLCGLGDDDGILIEPALQIVESAHANGVDAILTSVRSYSWPGLQHWLWGDVGGQILPTRRKLPFAKKLDAVEQVAEVFSDATVRGLGLLPRLYHGVVSRTALDRLLARTGSYFPGGSPDMANAVGLSYCVDALIYDPRAVIISGHSRKSGGGAGSAGKHHGAIEDQPHLPPGIIDRWPVAIPRYWSGHTIYAQSAIAAAEDATDRALPEFAFHRLYAACLVFDRAEYRRHIFSAMRQNPNFGAAMAVRVAVGVVGMTALRARAFFGSVWRNSIVRSRRRSFSGIDDLVSHLSAQKDW
ncbi:Glycosyl transferase family protein [Sphingopyxis sp. LC81]|uniref:glycosyltransferase family 2 protein n=1 Tax=Sphingopyxis sp. LC81 TaxID=1502850 RepID=UPI0005107334|nr:glycosyltransferase [Sphingopyxis sp. LC81]KGB54081.1 Glycosyl transferase family protein [Sphingopyxis sp. LC81]